MDRRIPQVVLGALGLAGLAAASWCAFGEGDRTGAGADSVSSADAPSPSASAGRFTLTPFDRGLPTQGQWRNGFDVADMDGDGELDLVHGPARKTFPLRPVIYLGDGRGAWRLWEEATFPSIDFDYGDVQAADLDGDGVLDLALAAHLKGVAALRHDGRGTFSVLGRGLDLQTGAPFGSRTVVTTIGRDGRPAILALSDGPRPPSPGAGGAGGADALGARIFVLVDAPSADVPASDASSPDAPREWQLDALATTALDRLFGDALALGDVDGDGVDDLAVGSNILGEPRVLFRRVGGAFVPVSIDGSRARALVRSVAFADVDGDARQDLVVAYAQSEGERWFVGVDLFANREGGFERREIAREESRNDYSAIAACNFDGAPRRTSLVAARGDGTVAIFAADGRGFVAFDQQVPNTGREGCRGYRVRCVDLDHDGKDELVASFAGESDGLAETDGCASQGSLAAWAVRASP